MRALATLAVLAGCGVEVQGGNNHIAGSDAGVDAALDAAVDARPCAGGDMHLTAPDGSCFALFTTPQPWPQAVATCNGIAAHVAVVKTAALDTAAEAFVGTLDTFIGLTDQATEGTFLWVDGTPLGFANWEAGEPSDGAGTYPEDCVVIAGSRPIKEWDDRPCMPVVGAGGGNYAVLCQF